MPVSPRPSRRRFGRRQLSLLPAGLVLVLAAGLLPQAIGAAQAAPPAAQSQDATSARFGTKTFDQKFSRSTGKFVQKLGRCVFFDVRGRIKGTRTTFRHGSGIGNRWRDVRIVAPSLRVTTKKFYTSPTGGTCGSDPAVVKKFVLKQQWKNRGCQVEIQSVSVGYPWAIGAGFGCSGGDDTAYRSSTDGRGKFATQFNSDAVINYKGIECSGECGFATQVRATTRIHRRMNGGSKSDQVSADFSVVLPG